MNEAQKEIINVFVNQAKNLESKLAEWNSAPVLRGEQYVVYANNVIREFEFHKDCHIMKPGNDLNPHLFNQGTAATLAREHHGEAIRYDVYLQNQLTECKRLIQFIEQSNK